MEAFAAAAVAERQGGSRRCYEVVVLGLTNKTFTAESGLVIKPHRTIQAAPTLDTLIIPGGAGLRTSVINSAVSAWVRTRAGKIRRIASVCTGIYGLASTGLLDGRRVTTHWRFARDVAQRFSKLRVEPNSLFVKDGSFYTSAGITAGIDLSLELIEEDYGPSVALSVARELVVYLKRPGGQEQYSEPLQFQVRSKDQFADLAAWIASHLGQDLSVPILADRACLSPRHFSRRFKTVFGITPAALIERMRLDEARRRLSVNDHDIDAVADSVGFSSTDAFRRAFERCFGLAPSSYRSRFRHASTADRDAGAHSKSGRRSEPMHL